MASGKVLQEAEGAINPHPSISEDLDSEASKIRINIGNVRVLGIVPDLKLKGNDFNIAVQALFVPYILIEVPSNILLKRVQPSKLITVMCFGWGVSCMCQGFVRNNGGLIATRCFVGLFEGGFLPAAAYMMSQFYKRHEMQRRLSVFWVAGLVAGAFGGLLAYALVHMNGLAGYSGWRWIFIIEGLLSIACVPLAYFFLTDWPEQSRYLSIDEKTLLARRHKDDLGGGATMNTLNKQAWISILSDWKVWNMSLCYFGISVSGYATALFIPTIISSLGYSGIQTQVESVPVWVVAAVACLLTGWLTDRLHHRYGFIMFGCLFAAIGYIILICQGPLKPAGAGLPLKVRYMAVYFATTGCYMVQPVVITFLANNISGHYKRAVSIAIQVGFGNCGGILASNLFVAKDGPRFFSGYGTALAMLGLVAITATIMAVGGQLENKKRNNGRRDERLHDPNIPNLGDADPRFRYTL